MDKNELNKLDGIMDVCKYCIEGEGFVVELCSYETTDGRMKYELYVKKEL